MQVRVSQRARRARIVVHPDRRVEVVVPPRTSRHAVERLVDEHREWVARRLSELEPVLGLERPGVVWIGGEPRPAPAGVDLGRWYRRQARRRIGAVAAWEGGRLDLRPRSLAIRDQRTRWGSCSSRGALSFNWRLVLAPPAVLRYVVVHELCHLREPNHSPAFWRLVESALPRYEEGRAWLRRHGHELLAYRVA
ncbi:MAG TPA: SprT family zinc-dependent metalloprotease [Gaiellaceae bacterium]